MQWPAPVTNGNYSSSIVGAPAIGQPPFTNGLNGPAGPFFFGRQRSDLTAKTANFCWPVGSRLRCHKRLPRKALCLPKKLTAKLPARGMALGVLVIGQDRSATQLVNGRVVMALPVVRRGTVHSCAICLGSQLGPQAQIDGGLAP